MRITSIGHAGMLVETAAGRIVCDPWFTPAYFASWFPFPDNSAFGSEADPAGIRDAEYLFVSHLHHDHFDPHWLAANMSKDTTVLLPDYQVPDLRDELEKLGFRNFVQTRNREVTELPGGLRILIDALITPTDGPLGDSGIAIDDGEVRIFNQNDARPVEDGPVAAFGPYDAHFLQYSGAIWYPMVYDFPERMKATVGRRKRENGMARALRYVDQYQAKQVFPFAGPPCFLDERDGLFAINDFDDDPANVFPSQLAFLEFMREQGHDNGHLFVPGTTVVLGADGKCEIEQVPQAQIDEIYGERRAYLTNYQKRAQPQIDAMHAGLPQDKSDLVGQLKEWIEPLLAWADHTCAGLNGRILLETVGPGRRRGGRPDRLRLPDPDHRGLGRRGGVPLQVPHRPAADRAPGADPDPGLGERALPVLPVPGLAQGPLQRVHLHVLQVAVRRAHDVRRGLLRRVQRRHGPGRGRGLRGAAALPAPEGGPDVLRHGRRRRADLLDAWLAVRPGLRALPDQ